MTGDRRTVQDVWDDAYDDHWNGDAYDVFRAFCAALGVDPSTPLDRLHILTDGQHVVREASEDEPAQWR